MPVAWLAACLVMVVGRPGLLGIGGKVAVYNCLVMNLLHMPVVIGEVGCVAQW